VIRQLSWPQLYRAETNRLWVLCRHENMSMWLY